MIHSMLSTESLPMVAYLVVIHHMSTEARDNITTTYELLTSSLADTISAACVTEATTSILSNNSTNFMVYCALLTRSNNNFNSAL